jgi:ATP-dependent helicase/nuclease subunit A
MAGENKINWTAQQSRAIISRPGEVLVTASAGTGKTSVLSGRYLDIVETEAVDVGQILVLTFTEAAAEQMKCKITRQLSEAFERKKDPRLYRQLSLIEAADISTIHSFCRRLITDHFHQLEIDPAFGIIDSDERQLLKAEVLEKTIDWAWQQPDLNQALARLLYRRDLRIGDGFLRNIIEISDFLDSIVTRDQWHSRAELAGQIAGPLNQQIAEKQKQFIGEKLSDILSRLEWLGRVYQKQCPNGQWLTKLQEKYITTVSGLIKLRKSGDWARFTDELENFNWPVYRRPEEISKTVSDSIYKKILAEAREDFKQLGESAVVNRRYLEILGTSPCLQKQIIVKLVKKFDELYSRAKAAVNCLDFADLEGYALKLLTQNDDFENLSPSETALQMRQKYKYIFVDEYQDINPVQQTILDLLSSGDNLFVVGDLKQSIYAFRGARPGIFLKRLKDSSVKPGDIKTRLRVDLNSNFRSEKPILDFVNSLFGRIMTGELAGITYDESAELKPYNDADRPATQQPFVELHLLDEPVNNDTAAADFSRCQLQAAAIARRIQRVVGPEPMKIYNDKLGEERDIKYSDIVILMRSPSVRVNDYIEVLQMAGVPVSSQDSAGFFEATEIRTCLSLLKVLDNPDRDIEFAAVLRSPVFNITDSQLAQIRIHADTEEKPSSFYQSVVGYCQTGPDKSLRKKLESVLDQIERWRTGARQGSLADLLWQIYRRGNLLGFVCGLPNGQSRRANLLKLHDRAIQFENFAASKAVPSLGRFVEFIEKLETAGRDFSPARTEAAAENAVRIMSVHKSKGLEFPVVFLAELNSSFNTSDITGDCLIDAEQTLGLKIIDRQSGTKISSLGHQVIAEKKSAVNLAEEMRILYVATTRAKNRLILTACEKASHCAGIISTGLFFDSGAVPGWSLRRCRSPLEWILLAFANYHSLHVALESDFAKEAHNGGLYEFTYYNQDSLTSLCDNIVNFKNRPAGPAERAEDQPSETAGLFEKIKSSLAWRYEYTDLAAVPAKLSVSELASRYKKDQPGGVSSLSRKPAAYKSSRTDAGLIGTATHLLLARLDLRKSVTIQTIQETIQKIVSEGIIAEPLAQQIDIESVLKFFETELGKAALEPANIVHTEWPFTFSVPAAQWQQADTACRLKSGDKETIIVQGIIDMLIKTRDGFMVIDFKTDNISAEQVRERIQIYQPQLALYGQAAEMILKSKLLGRWLYFLIPARAVSV